MDQIPYTPMIAPYKRDYSVLNGRRVKASFQEMFADIDDHYYTEYANLEDELISMGIPRNCLNLQTFFDGILRPKTLLEWSIFALPDPIKEKIDLYLDLVWKLPSRHHCLHNHLIYTEEADDEVHQGIYEPRTPEETAEARREWEEFTFKLSVSHDEYQMALEILDVE